MAANDRQEGGNHYNVKKYVQQHWDYAWDHEYDQFQYCITKYVDRHKYKNGLKDLYKARHHLEKYIELLEAEEEKRVGDSMRKHGVADMSLLPREYVNPDL